MRVVPYSNSLLGVPLFVALFCYFFASYYYGTAPGYLDHLEGALTLLSWDFINGQPLYTLPNSLNYSVNTYGPIHYLAQSTMLILGDPTIANSKLITLSASSLAILLFGIHIWRRYGYLLMSIVIVLLAAILLRQAPGSFSVRPDTLIFFIVIVALVVKDFDQVGRYGPVLLVAVCIGIAVNLKIYAPVFFFPMLINLMLKRETWFERIRLCVLIGIVAAIFAALPFFFSNISVITYLKTTYELVAARERSFDVILPLAKSLSVYLSPVVFLLLFTSNIRSIAGRQNLVYFMSLLLVSFALMYSASMPGAGQNHFIPIAPIVADLYVRIAKEILKQNKKLRHLCLCLIMPLFILIISWPSQKRLFRQVNYLHNSSIPMELEKLSTQYKNKIIMMGYGDNFESYKLSYFEPMLIFAGHPKKISALSLMELNASGFNPPNNLDNLVGRCNAHVWLIPKGENPFGITSYYAGNIMVFSDNFRRNFVSNYNKSGSTVSFDIWTCRD